MKKIFFTALLNIFIREMEWIYIVIFYFTSIYVYLCYFICFFYYGIKYSERHLFFPKEILAL